MQCTHDLCDHVLYMSFCEGKVHGSPGYDRLQDDLHQGPCNPRCFPRSSTAAAENLQTSLANDLK